MALKRLRESRDLSIAEVASRANIAPETLEAVEIGQHKLAGSGPGNLAKVFGINVIDMLKILENTPYPEEAETPDQQ